MIRIGICDDNKKENLMIQQLCENYFSKCPIEHEYKIFLSGEEVLHFCENDNQSDGRIDLLFLDIEMSGISGIEVKDRIVKEHSIWRIVFVSSHLESMQLAFGLKTMGFVIKPAKEEKIHKWLRLVVEDKQGEILVEIPKTMSGNKKYVLLEDIAYIKADGNYTEIYLYENQENPPLVVVIKLKELEKEWSHLPIIRVHKSYMVNLINVVDVGRNVILRDIEEKISIGRSYKEIVKKQYYEYGKQIARRRL